MSDGGHTHVILTEGLGMGFLGRPIRVSNDTFFDLMIAGRLRWSVGARIRHIIKQLDAANRLNQEVALTNLGADAAAISFDQT